MSSGELLKVTIAETMVLTIYILFLVLRFGVLKSISSSTYKLQGNWSYLFTVTLITLAILNMMQGLEIWGFLASVGLMFTGATINFKPNDHSYEDEIHAVSAVTIIACSMLGIGFVWGYWIVPGLFGLSALTVIESKNRIWWIEIMAFGFIMATYFYRALFV